MQEGCGRALLLLAAVAAFKLAEPFFNDSQTFVEVTYRIRGSPCAHFVCLCPIVERGKEFGLCGLEAQVYTSFHFSQRLLQFAVHPVPSRHYSSQFEAPF